MLLAGEIMQKDYLGFGLGLRTTYYETIETDWPAVDWFEILSENYMVEGGLPFYHLDQIAERYPIVMHGVSLSLGSTDPIDRKYLAQLKQLADRVQARWISEHLCWTSVNGINSHDLLPLPLTEEAMKHMIDRIASVQDYLGQQILIENVSSYIRYPEDEMTEWEFLTRIVDAADCLILLDINNIYVSSFNHQFDPYTYLHAIPKNRVQQFHLAGHTNKGTHLIDTHDEIVCPEVWDLYAAAVNHFGKVSTMIERDDNFPPFGELLNELNKAKQIAHHCLLQSATDVA